MDILGIDIGGSGIKAAIVDTEKGVLKSDRIRIDTPKPSKRRDVAKVIDVLIQKFNWKGVVGISFPTVIKNGKALQHGNLHKSWKNTQIDDFLNARIGGEFYILNDADSAALAVMKHGDGKGKEGLVITITLGTGIGSGVFFNGNLLPNFELGRLYGNRGDIMELFAADSARKRNQMSFKEWSKGLNFFLTHIENSFSPDLIIIGGGVSKKIDQFEKYLSIKTPFFATALKNDAGIIGAAMYADICLKKRK